MLTVLELFTAAPRCVVKRVLLSDAWRFGLLLNTDLMLSDSFIGLKPKSLARDNSCVGIWERVFVFFFHFLFPIPPQLFPNNCTRCLSNIPRSPLPQGKADRIKCASMWVYPRHTRACREWLCQSLRQQPCSWLTQITADVVHL